MLFKVLDLLKKERVLTACVIADKLNISSSRAETLFQILIDQGIVKSVKTDKLSFCTKCKTDCKVGSCN